MISVFEISIGIAKIVALSVILIGFLVTVSRLGARFGWQNEVKRKLLHAGLGLTTLSFPIVFAKDWEMMALGGVMIAIMLIIRLVPRFKQQTASGLYDVARVSYGELFFVISVIALYFLSDHEWVLYAVPLIILTLSDAAAALVGVNFGKRRFDVVEGKKSLEGVIAFGVVTFILVSGALMWLTSLSWTHIVLIAVLLALLGALTEAVAWKGMDNILVPMGMFLLLKHYLGASVAELYLSLVLVAGLVVLGLLIRRLSALNIHALMMAMILAYGLWQVAGWPFLVGPLWVFALHLGLSFWHKEDHAYSHEAIISIGATSLFWLLVSDSLRYPEALFLYYLSLAIHIQIILLIRLHAVRGEVASWWMVGIAALIASLSCFGLWLWFADPSPQSLQRVSIAALGLMIGGILRRVKQDRFAPERWRSQGGYALAGSLLGLCLIEGFGL